MIDRRVDPPQLQSFTRITWRCAAVALVVVSAACGGGSGAPASVGSDEKAHESGAGQPEQADLKSLWALENELGVANAWTGDLDGMTERGYIRALVVYNKTQYFIDGGTQRGTAYEGLREFERFFNERLGRRTLRIHVVVLPVKRDDLIPALTEGLGDLAVANLTITPERQAVVDFSRPVARGVRELVVTGPAAPELTGIDDLAGLEIHARRSSSYWESLVELNRSLSSRGLAPIELVAADEVLEDEDLLEMVNAGMLPMAVVDEHKARLWAQVLPEIVVREDLAVRTGGDVAWAFRKGSPQLAEEVNAFIRGHGQGTLFGNVILKRYLEDTRWVSNPTGSAGDARLETMIELFRRYGERYDFDPLLLAAMGYQESHLDQGKRSRAGAVGVMQIKPATAADPNVGITDVTDLENNIHAGTKYLAFLRDRYFSDPEMDQRNRNFFTMAAYNAGPARVRGLRAEAAEEGLDPNLWFGNVEVIAARRIGRETVRYVSNITKYWIAYRMSVASRDARATR
jgi:membrane-bound lytic murein transglycosylase MltF